MLKGLIGILAFLFALLVLVAMLVGGFVLRKIRQIKRTVQQAADQQARRYQEETGRQRRQYSQRAQSYQGNQESYGTQSTQRSQNAYGQEEPQSYQKTTQTATGETIIDNRHPERENKKIFDDSDGEYVEFVEEK